MLSFFLLKILLDNVPESLVTSRASVCVWPALCPSHPLCCQWHRSHNLLWLTGTAANAALGSARL